MVNKFSQFCVDHLGLYSAQNTRERAVHTSYKADKWKGYRYPPGQLFLRYRITILHTTLPTSSPPNDRIACAIEGRGHGCSHD